MEGMFPFTVQCLKCLTDWPTLAETYRRTYPNPSYKLMEMAEKFSDFLNRQDNLLEACPYLSDLAQYEWLDMVVLNLPDEPFLMPLSHDSRPSGLVNLSTGLESGSTVGAF